MPYDTTFRLNLKYDTNELIYKTETDLENEFMVAGVWGRRWEMRGRGS